MLLFINKHEFIKAFATSLYVTDKNIGFIIEKLTDY